MKHSRNALRVRELCTLGTDCQMDRLQRSHFQDESHQ